MTFEKLVSISDVEEGEPRNQFLRARAVYMTNEPFTKGEAKKYSVQDKNFIRDIQVARGVDKKEAIKLFKRMSKAAAEAWEPELTDEEEFEEYFQEIMARDD